MLNGLIHLTGGLPINQFLFNTVRITKSMPLLLIAHTDHVQMRFIV